MKKARSSPGRFMIGALILFFAAAFSRPALSGGQDPRLYMFAALVPGVLLLSGSKLINRLFAQDRILFAVSVSFFGFSILATALSDMDAARAQAVRCGGALMLMTAGSLIVRTLRPSGIIALLPAVPALVLLGLPLIVDAGFDSEVVAVALLMLSFVILLSVRKQLPAMLIAVAGTILMLARNNLVYAAIWSVTFLLLFWACSGHPVILLAGAGAVALSGYIAWMLLPDLFSAAGTPSVLSEISPGWIGLEASDPFLTSAESDNLTVFQWIAVRYGWIFAACVLMFYPVIILRGSALARASAGRLNAMLAMGAVLLTGLTAMAALLSDFGLWPVPGLSLPGLSRDLPSLFVFAFLMGLCGGVSARNQADLKEDEHIAMLAD